MGNVLQASEELLELRGKVVDEHELPVDGAQVKLESVGGQTFLALTDDRGLFNIASIPPGTYTVRIEKPQFYVLKGQQITFSAESGEFTFTLNREQEIHETVDVTAPVNQIEPEETARKDTLTETQIRDIPVPSSHNLQQSLVAMPEITRDNLNLLHVAGARSSQAQYLLNGFEIGNPINNLLDARLSVDAVRSAEVKTSRFGVEYAHPGAAVLLLDTPEGDDRWRFSATDFIPGINIQDGLRFGDFYPRFAVSGPIVPGKLWFSEALSVQHDLSISKDQPSGQNATEQWSGDTLTRLLWNVTPRHSIGAIVLYNKESDTDLGLDSLHPQSTTYDQRDHRIFASLRDRLWLAHTLFEFGIAGDDGYLTISPQGDLPYIQLVNGAKGNFYLRARREARRYQGFLQGTSDPLHWHGRHVISGGLNLSAVDLKQTAQRNEIQAWNAALAVSRITTFTGAGQFGFSNTMAGAFLQDSWTPTKRLVLQLGIRTDWNHITHSARGEPRIALNILPFKQEARGKLSLGWGIYDIPLNLSQIGQSYDQQQVDTLFNPNGGPVTSSFAQPSGNLQQPYFQIAGAGWQQRFGANTVVSLELISRSQHHGLVYVPEHPGQIGDTFLLQSTRRDKYRGATIAARHIFANSAELFGSYTRSSATTDQALDPFLGSLYFAPQQPGPLSWDAPNRFLTWGRVPLPWWGLFFGDFYEYRTGYPFSVVNQQQLLIGRPNSYRFPVYSSLTVSLEKKFRFGSYIFAIRVAAINVLNRENPDQVINNTDAPPSQFLQFSGGQGRALTGRIRFVGRKQASKPGDR